ncbi:MAG: hypothetical protein IPL35_05055 [Sphingobacteriales bacterium]|nr:hypothetical protein [Sphingobacteriales bacterium]
MQQSNCFVALFVFYCSIFDIFDDCSVLFCISFMKTIHLKTLSTLVALFFCLLINCPVKAQFEARAVIIEFSGKYYYSRFNGYRNQFQPIQESSLSIKSGLGYNILKNLQLGIGAIYQRDTYIQQIFAALNTSTIKNTHPYLFLRAMTPPILSRVQGAVKVQYTQWNIPLYNIYNSKNLLQKASKINISPELHVFLLKYLDAYINFHGFEALLYNANNEYYDFNLEAKQWSGGMMLQLSF